MPREDLGPVNALDRAVCLLTLAEADSCFFEASYMFLISSVNLIFFKKLRTCQALGFLVLYAELFCSILLIK